MVAMAMEPNNEMSGKGVFKVDIIHKRMSIVTQIKKVKLKLKQHKQKGIEHKTTSLQGDPPWTLAGIAVDPPIQNMKTTPLSAFSQFTKE